MACCLSLPAELPGLLVLHCCSSSSASCADQKLSSSAPAPGASSAAGLPPPSPAPCWLWPLTGLGLQPRSESPVKKQWMRSKQGTLNPNTEGTSVRSHCSPVSHSLVSSLPCPSHNGSHPSAQPHLILLLIVQGLCVSIWFSDQRVHQYKESHVEQQCPHHGQINDDNDLQLSTARQKGSVEIRSTTEARKLTSQIPLMPDLVPHFSAH